MKKSNTLLNNDMKLLLTSAGLSNQSIVNTFLDLAGKPFSELKMAFVPTAANVESGDKDWLISELLNNRLEFKIKNTEKKFIL